MKYSVFQICRRKIYVRIGLSLQCSVVLTAYGTGSKFLFDHDLNGMLLGIQCQKMKRKQMKLIMLSNLIEMEECFEHVIRIYRV